jgi:hypothetical protein
VLARKKCPPTLALLNIVVITTMSDNTLKLGAKLIYINTTAIFERQH